MRQNKHNSSFLDFKLSPCDEYWYFGFGVLHGVQVNLVDDVSGTTVGPETTSTKLTCTPCKTPNPKYQQFFFFFFFNRPTALSGPWRLQTSLSQPHSSFFLSSAPVVSPDVFFLSQSWCCHRSYPTEFSIQCFFRFSTTYYPFGLYDQHIVTFKINIFHYTRLIYQHIATFWN
jgi:hypothetical protein